MCRISIRKRGQFCVAHQQRELGIVVKPSEIKGAGLGLYTMVPRKKNERIAKYGGVITDAKHVDESSNYVLQLAANKLIDAKDALHSDYARFSNDANYGNTGKKNNAKLSFSNATNTASVKASRPIKAKSEVLTSYGRDYWKDKRNEDKDNKRMAIKS